MTRTILRLLLGLAMLLVPWPDVGLAQPGDEIKTLKEEIERLKEGQRRVQKEIDAIKGGLEERRVGRAGEPSNVVLRVNGDPAKGDPAAGLLVIEFSDYQCPFCARHVREILPRLERDYIETGKLKYLFRDFPIASLHPQASRAHEAAHCAGEQGRYWEMHDRLFADPKAHSRQDLPDHARVIGLDRSSFEQCLEGGRHAARIRDNIAEGRRAGVRGTPTFFLGLSEPGTPAVKVLEVIRGAQPYATFRQAIDRIVAAPSVD